MYKIIALDVGRVRIGIAVSDLMQIIATPYENYKRKNIKEDITHINNIIINNDIKKVVVGMPYNMDGSLNAQCESIKGFTEEFKKVVLLPVEYTDERFSTVSAESLLIKADVGRNKRKNLKDKLAAAVFLQSYLDKIKNKGV